MICITSTHLANADTQQWLTMLPNNLAATCSNVSGIGYSFQMGACHQLADASSGTYLQVTQDKNNYFQFNFYTNEQCTNFLSGPQTVSTNCSSFSMLVAGPSQFVWMREQYYSFALSAAPLVGVPQDAVVMQFFNDVAGAAQCNTGASYYQFVSNGVVSTDLYAQSIMQFQCVDGNKPLVNLCKAKQCIYPIDLSTNCNQWPQSNYQGFKISCNTSS
ncbi:hypothetical protein SAMD00019534_106130 [Acytostelium subglobosum LB1]|uniref:hypothetical protein n=1 Tax=Acytostelium subglobosum LB1 TaxID=1410327 RepID=UPI000645207A|nr:hypothetical protein SAMD00019534_106130 [Acytostelium subglobosum LB1]GAM27437.1 hypothetical protein SAMD00019534_106130 [Acytostelium subglobosum LB1]|eukprot:XP_012749502.1 hypothetical protein SAMD00019534_106130 [Acytostelium subglobosum LB1]